MTRAHRLPSVCGALVMALALGVALAAAAGDKVPAAGGAIEITPLIHSSIQLEHAGKVIQVDPWSALDLSRYKKADLILITDDPVHHLDLKAIAALRKPGAPRDHPGDGEGEIPRWHHHGQW